MKAILIAVVSLMTTVSYACQAQEPVVPVTPLNAPLTALALATGENILTADQGLTVYVFDVDTTSESQCYNACENAWPPVLAPAAGVALGANMGTTVRKDGAIQLTREGRPLYYYIGDGAAGDINGDGLGGVWHIVTL